MASIVDQVHSANGVFMAMYTSGNNPMQPGAAYAYFSKWFEPDYMSGQMPDIWFDAWPWNIVVRLEDGVILASGEQVSLAEITTLVNQSNI